MRILSVFLATLFLPATAFAAGGTAQDNGLSDWDYTPLYDDWNLADIMGGDVMASDGVKVGTVNDIVFDESGLIDTVVVQREDESGDWSFYEVSWANIDFDPALREAELKVDSEAVDGFADLQIPDFSGPEEVEASNLLGMNVNLDGMAPYGEVDGLLVTEGANALTAVIVESDGLGTFRYALPADIEDLDANSVVLELPYTVEDVEALEWYMPESSV